MISKTTSHFRILEILAEGGMGRCHRATSLKLDRDVALKLLSVHLAGDADARSHFLRKVKAAAALDRPNISTGHDIDEAGE